MNENYDGFILSRGFNKRKKSVIVAMAGRTQSAAGALDPEQANCEGG